MGFNEQWASPHMSIINLNGVSAIDLNIIAPVIYLYEFQAIDAFLILRICAPFVRGGAIYQLAENMDIIFPGFNRDADC